LHSSELKSQLQNPFLPILSKSKTQASNSINTQKKNKTLLLPQQLESNPNTQSKKPELYALNFSNPIKIKPQQNPDNPSEKPYQVY
jgi:hypothetical protein